MSKTTQLRRYQIQPGKEDALVQGWGKVIPSLRAAHGFTIEFAYLDKSNHVFVWAVSVEGTPEDFTAAEKAYYEAKGPQPYGPKIIEKITAEFVEDHTPPRTFV